MKKLLFLTFLLSLSACAMPQKTPIIAQGKKYYDPNIPAINLNLPFNVFHQKEEVEHTEFGRIVSHYLTTDKDNIYLYIRKNELFTANMYYTGADNKSVKYVQFRHKDQTDNCIVYIYEDKETLNYYLLGSVKRHSSQKKVQEVIMGKNIGYISSPACWALEHSDEIDDFITDFKKICFQFIE